VKVLWDTFTELVQAFLGQQAVQAGLPPPKTATVEIGWTGYDRSADEDLKRLKICGYSLSQIGKPYHLGVENDNVKDPATWDCSELVQIAYDRAGVTIPDGSNFQYDFCRPVREPKKGDLGFVWSKTWNRIGHVIVYTGDGFCVEARGTPFNQVRTVHRSDWEGHPAWRGWRRHPDFSWPVEER
jgi:cell wall-associated NlpC family hydrolase